MSLKDEEITDTYAAAVDFELSNEVDSIKVAVNTSDIPTTHISHLKPSESCFKYNISWRNIALPINKSTDRFGLLRIIPNQRIGVIGRVQRYKNDYRIVPITRHQKWYHIFKLDLLHGLLLFPRESEASCQRRLNGGPTEALPTYTPLSCGYDPPDYDERIAFSKIIKLPFKAQESIIRRQGSPSASKKWVQEILFLCLIIIVIALAVLPMPLGLSLPLFWYWPILVLSTHVAPYVSRLDTHYIQKLSPSHPHREISALYE